MLKQIFPVAILFAVSLVFANKAYIYLSVSYIQVSVLVSSEYVYMNKIRRL
jgi:hypothetical protein